MQEYFYFILTFLIGLGFGGMLEKLLQAFFVTGGTRYTSTNKDMFQLSKEKLNSLIDLFAKEDHTGYDDIVGAGMFIEFVVRQQKHV